MRELATRKLVNPPAWQKALIALRDAMVTPFGIKTSDTVRTSWDRHEREDFFPVHWEGKDEILLGTRRSWIARKIFGGVPDARLAANVRNGLFASCRPPTRRFLSAPINGHIPMLSRLKTSRARARVFRKRDRDAPSAVSHRWPDSPAPAF